MMSEFEKFLKKNPEFQRAAREFDGIWLTMRQTFLPEIIDLRIGWTYYLDGKEQNKMNMLELSILDALQFIKDLTLLLETEKKLS